jgi:Icc-related predicted phosphoesterase
MRLCHTSDNHGTFNPLLGHFDIIVHSGDFFPDPPGNPNFKEEIGKWQLEWLEENMIQFTKWIGNHPFLFTLGNHDHVNPLDFEKLLKSWGIDATCLHDAVITHKGINFYGFPYVPYINGSFAYEKELSEMIEEVEWMTNNINNTSLVDVLVCHCPPFGILDRSYNNNNWGSTAIADALNFKIKADKHPTYYLCGHVHHSMGIKIVNNICFSNAATFQQILEV